MKRAAQAKPVRAPISAAVKRARRRLMYAADGTPPNRETRARRAAYIRLVSAWNQWGLEE